MDSRFQIDARATNRLQPPCGLMGACQSHAEAPTRVSQLGAIDGNSDTNGPTVTSEHCLSPVTNLKLAQEEVDRRRKKLEAAQERLEQAQQKLGLQMKQEQPAAQSVTTNKEIYCNEGKDVDVGDGRVKHTTKGTCIASIDSPAVVEELAQQSSVEPKVQSCSCSM